MLKRQDKFFEESPEKFLEANNESLEKFLGESGGGSPEKILTVFHPLIFLDVSLREFREETFEVCLEEFVKLFLVESLEG